MSKKNHNLYKATPSRERKLAVSPNILKRTQSQTKWEDKGIRSQW